MKKVLPTKERWLPLSVLLAKKQQNSAELSRLGRRGNEVKKERRELLKRQGLLPLKAKRPSTPRAPLTPEQKAELAHTRYVNQLLRQERAAITRKGAEDHAEANRAGWCDEDE